MVSFSRDDKNKSDMSFIKNKGSIRQNFNEEDSDEEEDRSKKVDIPGPGSYLNGNHFTSFNTQRKPESYQFFGSSVERFKDKKDVSQLGPGQYALEKALKPIGKITKRLTNAN